MDQNNPQMGHPMQPQQGAPNMGGPQMGAPNLQSQNIEPAGVGPRFVAAIIDGIIISIPVYAVLLPLMGLLFSGGVSDEKAAMLNLVSMPLSLGLTILYYGYFYTTKGASPGKLVFNIRVVDQKTGMKLTWGQTILRETIGKWVSGIILMIGYIMAMFRDDKRALHDLISGSQCLRKR